MVTAILLFISVLSGLGGGPPLEAHAANTKVDRGCIAGRYSLDGTRLIDWDARVRQAHTRGSENPDESELTRAALDHNLRRIRRVIEEESAKRPDFKIIVSGYPRMGKTTVLHQLQDWLRKRGMAPIYVLNVPTDNTRGLPTAKISQQFSETLASAAAKELPDFQVPLGSPDWRSLLKPLADRRGVVLADEAVYLAGHPNDKVKRVGIALVRDLARQRDVPVIFNFLKDPRGHGFLDSELNELRQEFVDQGLARNVDLVMPGFQDLRGYLTHLTRGTPVFVMDDAVRALLVAADHLSGLNSLIRKLPETEPTITWETVARTIRRAANGRGLGSGVHPISLHPGGPRPVDWSQINVPEYILISEADLVQAIVQVDARGGVPLVVLGGASKIPDRDSRLPLFDSDVLSKDKTRVFLNWVLADMGRTSWDFNDLLGEGASLLPRWNASPKEVKHLFSRNLETIWSARKPDAPKLGRLVVSINGDYSDDRGVLVNAFREVLAKQRHFPVLFNITGLKATRDHPYIRDWVTSGEAVIVEAPKRLRFEEFEAQLRNSIRRVVHDSESPMRDPKFQKPAIARLFELSEGDPQFANRLIGELSPDERRIDVKDVEAAFERVREQDRMLAAEAAEDEAAALRKEP